MMNARRGKPKRYVRIGGRDLFVFDGLFSRTEVRGIHDELNAYEFTDRACSSDATSRYREWACPLLVADFADHAVHKRAAATLHRTYPDVPFEFWDVHCNNTTFGDWGFTHRDSREPGAYSILYYANATWKPTWEGETVFFDHRREPRISISPRPGRLVAFDSRILHRAGIPSRSCPVSRLTLSLRYAAPHEATAACAAQPVEVR